MPKGESWGWICELSIRNSLGFLLRMRKTEPIWNERRPKPCLNDLCWEPLLLHAWKKSHDYVRYHNWFADVLALDLSNTRLRDSIRSIQESVKSKSFPKTEPVRMVPAPKSSTWEITKKRGWRPVKGHSKLRPLAHVTMREQTIATAFLICLADRVESRQGDPTWSLSDCRKMGMVSYGNRLLCDTEGADLKFRWGNATLYRAYFQDYQSFVRRPDKVVQTEFKGNNNWAIVHADLSQFYDRVRPEALVQKASRFADSKGCSKFLPAFERFFLWRWHPDDRKNVSKYASDSYPHIRGFEKSIALPQGLAASGFFANIFLLDFDEAIWNSRHMIAGSGWQVVDYCRYVDDMRFVLQLPPQSESWSRLMLAEEVSTFIQDHLAKHASELHVNPDKTDVLLGRDEAARMVVYADTMATIQANTSGVMDIAIGQETMQLIEQLLLERATPPPRTDAEIADPFFTALPDVREESVVRFAANRFRKTYRSMRLLCGSDERAPDAAGILIPNKSTIDHKAGYVSRQLLWRWVRDPSNVRLMRIAVDIFPDRNSVARIISLLSPHVLEGKSRGNTKCIAEYCTAELIKAAVTETGMVVDGEQLPTNSDLQAFQATVLKFVRKLHSKGRLPWFLEQQTSLFLACHEPTVVNRRRPRMDILAPYDDLHRAMNGEYAPFTPTQAVQYLLVVRQIKSDATSSIRSFLATLRKWKYEDAQAAITCLLEEDREAASDVWMSLKAGEQRTWRPLFRRYGIGIPKRFPYTVEKLRCDSEKYRLDDVLLSSINPFRQEIVLLKLLQSLLKKMRGSFGVRTLTPWDVEITANWNALMPENDNYVIAELSIDISSADEIGDPIYRVPGCVEQDAAWKYICGQLMRAALVGNIDFSAPGLKRPDKRTYPTYRPYRSHWYRRRFGHFNGRNGLGPEWLPISNWLTSLLSRLLAWPGYRVQGDETGLPQLFTMRRLENCVQQRINHLTSWYGRGSRTTVLPSKYHLTRVKGRSLSDESDVKLRAAVIQTVLPTRETLVADPILAENDTRIKQRSHFASSLAALGSMLRLRDSHMPWGGQLDLLVLPELSLHRDDVWPIAVPFARQHRCIIFAGMVYHRLDQGPTAPLVNTGLWIIPYETASCGLRVDLIMQGKLHIAPEERKKLSAAGLKGYRPAQHLICVQASFGARRQNRRWTMTGSICYDATDISLAADLRDRTDTWLIPSLNCDVGLFDTMVGALHYHSFQHIVLANNGSYGGSTAQAPFGDHHKRTIFHHHGNDQAAISFFEIDDLHVYYRRGSRMKSVPAGYKRHKSGR